MCLVKCEEPVELRPVALIQCKDSTRGLPRAERLVLLEIAHRHRMADVFLARPGQGAGSVELVDLVGGRTYELPSVTALTTDQALRLVSDAGMQR